MSLGVYFTASAPAVVQSGVGNDGKSFSYAQQSGTYGYGRLIDGRPEYSQPYNMSVSINRSTGQVNEFEVGVVYQVASFKLDPISIPKMKGFHMQNLVWEKLPQPAKK